MRLGEDDARTALAYLEADLERLNATGGAMLSLRERPKRAGATRILRRCRVIDFGIVAFNLVLMVNDMAGHHPLAASLNALTALVMLLFIVAFLTPRIHRIDFDNRPRPDYAHIARMEREVYGETFHHDGAPEPREPVRRSIVISDAERRRYTCDSGYHIYAVGEPGCMYCDRDH